MKAIICSGTASPTCSSCARSISLPSRLTRCWCACTPRPSIRSSVLGDRPPRRTTLERAAQAQVRSIAGPRGSGRSRRSDVKELQPGDEVFGTRSAPGPNTRPRASCGSRGSLPTCRSRTPPAVPVAALTALQALRDKGRVQAGQKVLINGRPAASHLRRAARKALGAEVTGVTSTRNVDLVRSLGQTTSSIHARGLHASPRALRPDARHRRHRPFSEFDAS